MAKRRKRKGGIAAALICLFMAAVTLLQSGRLDLPAITGAIGDLGDAVSAMGQTPAEPVDGLFEMIALDVGQGDSFLLRTREKSVLIDTGEAEYAGQVIEALNRYGVEELDLAIATHMHSDHMGGMAEVLEAVPAKTFVMTELPEEGGPAHRLSPPKEETRWQRWSVSFPPAGAWTRSSAISGTGSWRGASLLPTGEGVSMRQRGRALLSGCLSGSA